MEKQFNTKRAAARLQVSTSMIARWVREGKFPNAGKVNPEADNSPYIIPMNDIELFEKNRKEKGLAS